MKKAERLKILLYDGMNHISKMEYGESAALFPEHREEDSLWRSLMTNQVINTLSHLIFVK